MSVSRLAFITRSGRMETIRLLDVPRDLSALSADKLQQDRGDDLGGDEIASVHQSMIEMQARMQDGTGQGSPVGGTGLDQSCVVCRSRHFISLEMEHISSSSTASGHRISLFVMLPTKDIRQPPLVPCPRVIDWYPSAKTPREAKICLADVPSRPPIGPCSMLKVTRGRKAESH